MNIKEILTVGIILITTFVCIGQQDYPLILAEKYGLSEFEEIKSIEFTFNVNVQGEVNRRHWKWNPNNDTVTLTTVAGRTDFNTNKIETETDAWLNKKFINDSYWLLFPYYLSWDRGAYKYKVEQDVKSPILKKQTKKLVIEYINDTGYTPGDIYELFITEDDIIIEWIYRKGGSEKPTKITTWEKNILEEGVKISTSHYGTENDFRVWFEDIKIEK